MARRLQQRASEEGSDMTDREAATVGLNLAALGDAARAARDARGWTQVQLAVRAELSPSWVSKTERGEGPPPQLDDLFKLANALGVPVTDLVAAASDQEALLREAEKDPLLSAGLAGLSGAYMRTAAHAKAAMLVSIQAIADLGRAAIPRRSEGNGQA
jgi:transcriptional regulator with XRE-family HTH domain